MHIFWARLTSFCHLGIISDPLIVSKFHNETHDSKGKENNIYTIVKGRETFYRCHTVPVTSCREVKYVLKRVSFGSKDCTRLRKMIWLPIEIIIACPTNQLLFIALCINIYNTKLVNSFTCIIRHVRKISVKNVHMYGIPCCFLVGKENK